MIDVHLTRDQAGYLQTVSFTHRGHQFVCESDGGHIAAGGPARISNARWRVTVDGTDIGTQFDMDVDDTDESVRARVVALWEAGRATNDADPWRESAT